MRHYGYNIYAYTPPHTQKTKQVKLFGKDKVDIVLKGDSLDDAFDEANRFCEEDGAVFIHPFDDEKIIAGQGRIGLELLEDCDKPIDYLFVPIGGGGLASGIITVFKQLSPHTKIIGVELVGAASMKTAIEKGEIVTIETCEEFNYAVYLCNLA